MAGKIPPQLQAAISRRMQGKSKGTDHGKPEDTNPKTGADPAEPDADDKNRGKQPRQFVKKK